MAVFEGVSPDRVLAEEGEIVVCEAVTDAVVAELGEALDVELFLLAVGVGHERRRVGSQPGT